MRATSAGISVPITDALGSVIAETNTAQSVTRSYGYDPYGATTPSGTSTGNAQQYTGRENDGTGLYYYRASYYNPTSARFISEDPLRWRSGQTNDYAYVNDDPLTRRDPLGLCGCKIDLEAANAAAERWNYWTDVYVAAWSTGNESGISQVIREIEFARDALDKALCIAVPPTDPDNPPRLPLPGPSPTPLQPPPPDPAPP
jgi:RHS repeat-associated protein